MNKQSTPKVSVIMAAYNTAKTLKEAVDSVIAQTYSNWELFIIIDPSTDNTASLAQEISENDTRIRVFELQERLFPGGVRNIGLSESSGKYIAILDADDMALPERFSKEVQFLEANPDIFLVGTGSIIIDEKGDIQLENRSEFTTSDEIRLELPKRNVVVHSSVMYRNEGYRYREKITRSQDYDLYLRLLTDGKKLANIEEPLIKYRLSSSSTSVVDNADSVQPKMKEKILAMYEQRLKFGYDNYEEDTFEDIKLLNATESPMQKDWRQIRIYIRSGDQAKVKLLSSAFFMKYKTIKGLLALFYSYLPSSLARFIINRRRKLR